MKDYWVTLTSIAIKLAVCFSLVRLLQEASISAKAAAIFATTFSPIKEVLLIGKSYRDSQAAAFDHLKSIFFVPGGDPRRERFAVTYALRTDPAQPALFSSACLHKDQLVAYQEAEKEANGHKSGANIIIEDRTAIDTVTNFTSLSATLVHAQVESVTIITDDYHYRRTLAIARIVWGSIGISTRGVEYRERHDAIAHHDDGDLSVFESQVAQESIWKLVRDVSRAMLWVTVGVDGSRLSRLVQDLIGKHRRD